MMSYVWLMGISISIILIPWIVLKIYKTTKFKILYLVTLFWVLWTLGLSTLVVGYALGGPLFIVQLVVIAIAFYFSRNRLKLNIEKLETENENKKLKEDLRKLRNQVLRQAHEKNLSREDFFSIEGVKEHRKLLENAISSSKRHVLILSGWATSYVIDGDFKTKMKLALKRGVDIYIGFGYTDSNEKRVESKYQKRARKTLDELKKWCSENKINGSLKVSEFSNHAKLLIKDYDFAAIGSFNWLSNARGKNFERSWVIKSEHLVKQEFRESQKMLK